MSAIVFGDLYQH